MEQQLGGLGCHVLGGTLMTREVRMGLGGRGRMGGMGLKEGLGSPAAVCTWPRGNPGCHC